MWKSLLFFEGTSSLHSFVRSSTHSLRSRSKREGSSNFGSEDRRFKTGGYSIFIFEDRGWGSSIFNSEEQKIRSIYSKNSRPSSNNISLFFEKPFSLLRITPVPFFVLRVRKSKTPYLRYSEPKIGLKIAMDLVVDWNFNKIELFRLSGIFQESIVHECGVRAILRHTLH